MSCREVVELMTEYLEDALSADQRRRFEDHISGCPGCREYLAQLRATRHLAAKLNDEPVPERLHDELVRAFRDWRSK